MTPEPRIDYFGASPTLWEDDSEVADFDQDNRKWFVQEAWFTRATSGRALHTSRMWDYESGVHLATTFQDGLVRFDGNSKL
jgi:acyl-CoA thioesterase